MSPKQKGRIRKIEGRLGNMEEKKIHIRNSIEYLTLPIILLSLWWFYERTGGINTVSVPKLAKIVETFRIKWQDKSLFAAVYVSIRRVLEGYALAVICGLSLGIMIGLSTHMKRFTDLIIQILKPIPPIAWIPLAILWFGIGEESKVFLIFLGGFFVVLVNVIDGVAATDEHMIEVAKMAQIGKTQYILQVILPSALPSIFTGLRVGLNTCWTCVVAAELVASSSGIGYMISNARNYGRMDIVIMGMFTIGVIGKIMDVILKQIEKRVIVWK